ncbi:anthranilate synthase component II [Corynebacterium epidermidicanis]|uniref:anthranilate synthase n=1 Tax=Corynebacterium epidermidicanis TaxID=1050174 RepID=A0A0G3GT78_9CORY|nr:aminodeoxychorismate/anthranilate synthase component II [Corynebacterium epidermidicanis]AKK04329.1 anthranilate/para-aminobenzoate synthase component II [Corynebacterium epidermidicanis]
MILVDNFDSFTYNLVDALNCRTVVRNTIAPQALLDMSPELVVLSPGPGHPRDAGNLMSILATCLQEGVPVLGICLGFQAIVEHFGGTVQRCGPVHGMRSTLTGTPLFDGQSVARYHSLGATSVPAPLEALAWADGVVMAASAPGVLGLQFHPESILTTNGPAILNAAIKELS